MHEKEKVSVYKTALKTWNKTKPKSDTLLTVWARKVFKDIYRKGRLLLHVSHNADYNLMMGRGKSMVIDYLWCVYMDTMVLYSIYLKIEETFDVLEDTILE